MDTYTLLTGATSGIGLDLAIRLSGERNLILVGRNEAKLDEVIRQIGGTHKVLKLVIDLDADRRQVGSRLAEFIQSGDLQIEALVHCAGTSKVMPLRQADTDSIDSIFNVNILSAMELIRPLLKKENKGTLKNIVFISSLASIRGEKGNAVYAASKGALNAMAISLAKELAPKVRVNSVSPGTVETPMTQAFIESLGYECQKVEEVTTYPSILGGRVKTLHPKVFGGILGRRDNEGDREQMAKYEIPEIDLVVVDLYPFEQTVASGAGEADIIEKIDIGGISLIRAAAKNFNDVVIVPSKAEYSVLLDMLNAQGAETTLEQRRMLAARAFGVSSHYDTAIHGWFSK